LGATSETGGLATSPPGREWITPELSPETLLLEIAFELLGFLSTLLASVAAPQDKNEDQDEEDAEYYQEDLPPDEASTTTSARLLCVGVERWDDGGWGARSGNQLTKADSET
jgi:hypothetical protein